MAITANPAVDSSTTGTTLDSFLKTDANSIGSWADQCDEAFCENSLNSEDTGDSSFGTDNGEGWNKVRSKSERLESRNPKPIAEDRFRKFPKYRYKTSQYFASRYMQQRKSNPDTSLPNRNEYSPRSNQCPSDLHSNSESGDSDIKQLDAKEKEPEFVDAPVPKVNPWSKSNSNSSHQTSPKPTPPIPEMSHKVDKKTVVKSSPRLPGSCGWGKGSNSPATQTNETSNKSSPRKDQQTWPTLDEVSSPKSAISLEKQSPESQSSLSSSNKVAKKKTKQRTKSDRNKLNNMTKLELDDSDSSKDNFADSPSSALARRKKGRQRWTTLDVDVKPPVRRGYSYPAYQRNKYRPRQYERDYDRSYSARNERSKGENEFGNRRWSYANRGKFNRRRAKGRGRTPSQENSSFGKQGQDGYEAFDEFQFINEELPASQLVIFDGYPQCSAVIEGGDVQVFIPDETYAAPTIEYVQWQIEYYFSPSNLKGDFFLRRRMDKNGFVPLSLIGSFRAIQNLTNDIQVVYEAAKESSMLELDGDRVRCREEPEKWVMEGDGVDDLVNYKLVPMAGYELPVVSPDSEEQFSSVSYDSACYVLDETLCQYQAAEEVNEDLLARSEMWKWVDAPVFIPKKSVSVTQDSEKLSQSESSEVDGSSIDKQSDSGVSGSIVLSKEKGFSSSLPNLKASCESKAEERLTSRLRKTSLEQEPSKIIADTKSSPSTCKRSPTSTHRQSSDSQT